MDRGEGSKKGNVRSGKKRPRGYGVKAEEKLFY